MSGNVEIIAFHGRAFPVNSPIDKGRRDVVAARFLETEVNVSKLLNLKQLAEHLNINWRTAWRYAKTGKLPAGIQIGNLRRWDIDEVDEFLRSKKTTTSNSTAVVS